MNINDDKIMSELSLYVLELSSVEHEVWSLKY